MADLCRYTIAIGTSAGGIDALKMIFSALPETFNLPILVVQHIGVEQDDALPAVLGHGCPLTVSYANDKERIRPSHIYLAPPNYHLMLEDERTLTLSVDPKVRHCRPSIDVLFDSAAYSLGSRLAAFLLTGANTDGADGVRSVKGYGGLVVVEDPATAQVPVMPQAGLDACPVDYVLSLQDIPDFLCSLMSESPHNPRFHGEELC